MVNKKAQMEIIGLVIIVILISLGMLFMAKFGFEDDSGKKIFARKGLASSTMGALLKMSVVCEDQNDYNKVKMLSVEHDLIDDCARNLGLGSSQFGCGGEHSCDFLESTFKELLKETLGEWGRNYELNMALLGDYADAGPEEIFSIKSGEGGDGGEGKGCSGETDRDSSGSFLVKTGVGSVEGVLYVCD